MSAGGPLAILHVDPERGLGGGERQVLGLVAHLHAAGHAQTLAAHPGGPLAAAAADLGVAVAPLVVRNHFDVSAARALASLLARNRYDILHFHTARAHAMTTWLAASPGVARVVTRRMDYRLRGGWYVRRLYNHGVQAVIAISEGVRAALIASGVDAGRIHLVPSGVAVERFASVAVERFASPAMDGSASLAPTRAAARARLGVDDATCLVAVVGALEERKGHDVLLDAVARVPDAPLAVRCAGAGSRAAALAARCATLGLGARVRFLGHLDDVAPLLAAADVLAMPSRQEGLGVAALEGMAAGLPVIASRVGGLPEAVVDGETGLLVPPGDADALAVALARLATDPAFARWLGGAGRQHVAARFTMAAMAEGTLAVYRRLCEGRAA